jgi:hypothetical protein
MKRSRCRAHVVTSGVLVAMACGQSIPLAENLQLDAHPQQIMFAQPVTTDGERALRLEFVRPGDRQGAAGIHVVLLGTGGSSDTLRPLVDQVGETAVCLRERSNLQATYTGLRVSSQRPLRVKRLSWTGQVRRAQDSAR